MFPSEYETNIRQQAMQREAEHARLVKSLRTEPTVWQRLRVRLSARFAASPAPQPEKQLAHRDVIALSR